MDIVKFGCVSPIWMFRPIVRVGPIPLTEKVGAVKLVIAVALVTSVLSIAGTTHGYFIEFLWWNAQKIISRTL